MSHSVSLPDWDSESRELCWLATSTSSRSGNLSLVCNLFSYYTGPQVCTTATYIWIYYYVFSNYLSGCVLYLLVFLCFSNLSGCVLSLPVWLCDCVSLWLWDCALYFWVYMCSLIANLAMFFNYLCFCDFFLPLWHCFSICLYDYVIYLPVYLCSLLFCVPVLSTYLCSCDPLLTCGLWGCFLYISIQDYS